MKVASAVACLGILLLAGCLGGSDERTPQMRARYGEAVRYVLPADPMPEGPGHDHASVEQHRFLWNYDFASRDAMRQNDANVAGVHALDLQAGYLFGAVYGSHAASVDGGLVIWDLADPARPVETGRWTIPGSVGGDRSMEATPDGDYAVIATESLDCAGHVNPLATVAAYLIDTSDKSLPVVADVYTFTGQSLGSTLASETNLRPPGVGFFGEHSVAVHRIGGEDYAFIQGKVFHIERSEQGARLVYVSDINTGHDLYVRDTPWNTTWAIAANGGGGLLIYDVTDPADPFELAVGDLPERDALEENGTEHYFHTADVSFQDGQVVLVLTSEDWGQTASPLWLIDGNPLVGRASRPEEPILLEQMGTWQNPGNHPALAGLTFSLHNPRFHDGGILTLSSYHGGMWQLDTRHPEFWVDPAPIAYAAYADGTPTAVRDPVEDAIATDVCGLAIALDAPSYWDVEVGADGVAYLADGFMGLYTFTPTADHPVYGAAPPGTYAGTAGT